MSSITSKNCIKRKTSPASHGSSGHCDDRISKDRSYRHSVCHRPGRRDSKIRNLCDRLQSVRSSSLSLPAGSSHHVAVPSSVDASHECQPQASPHSEVVLNLEIMENEMGLRPTGLVRRSSQCSSGRTPSQGTPRNEFEDSLETNNSPLTMDDKGQLRYFGYSSSMRMVSVLPQSKSPPTQDASCLPGEKSIDIMGEAMADNPQTQSRLIDLFFKYQNASIPILDEEVFRLGYIMGERSDYFSRFLLYSLFLRSLNFDDDLLHRETLATIYMQRAKAELLFEMENPTIATIPALCLFGYYLAGLGSDRACWLYPGSLFQCTGAVKYTRFADYVVGIAYRLVFDFGLHEDCKNLVAAGLLTEVDQRVRQITLYGCYVLDK